MRVVSSRRSLTLLMCLIALAASLTAPTLSPAAPVPRVGKRPPMGDCIATPWPCAWNTGLASVQATPVRRGGVVTLYAYPLAQGVTASWDGTSSRIPGDPLPGSCKTGARICRFRLDDRYSAVHWSAPRKEWVSVGSPGWVDAGGIACAAIGCASMWTWVPVVEGYGIAGTVRDAEGAALSGVKVVVSGGGQRAAVTSGEYGYYLAEVPSRVRYTLTAPRGFCARGISPCTRTRTVQPNVTNVDFRKRA